MKFVCAYSGCGKTGDKPTGQVNRARVGGLNLYCDRRCAGLGRRKHKTKAQKVEEKRLYDAEYRRKNLALLKAKKHAYFVRTYDPEKARVERKKRMPKHVEYCRQPEYRAKKHLYDVRRYHTQTFGPFAQASMMLRDLNIEVKGRMTNEQIAHANGTQNKTQRRRRATAEEPQRSRPRGRARRPSHSTAHG